MLKSIATLSAQRRMTEETLREERRHGIGGSDVGQLYNIGYGCKRRLWYEKRGTTPDFPKPHVPEFDRGTALEPVVRSLYVGATGRTVTETGVIAHPDYPFILAHLDGTIDGIEGEYTGVFEAKTANRFVWKKFEKEGIRDEYLLQMQHYLLVTGYQWGSFGLLCVDPWKFQYFDVNRDESLCATLLQDEVAFWGQVENGPTPDPLEDLKDRRCATCEFRRTCRGEALTAPTSPNDGAPQGELVPRPELTPLLAEIQDLGLLKDEATELYEEARGKLKAEIGDAYGLVAGGFRALYPTSFPERWDTKALTALVEEAKRLIDYSPIDYEQLEIHLSALIATLKGFIKAKKPAKAERSLRIYATGD